MSMLSPLTELLQNATTNGLAKRTFDLFVTSAASIAWLPAMLFSALAILVFDGMPVLYVSPRRVFRDLTIPVPKFRTMRRDAELIANRETVPLDGVRFLNIGRDSPLYTGIGRLLERLCFTELPQLIYVMSGRMSLIGNRPLPENVIAAIKEAHPWAEERFDTPAGLTGPIQLVGRERLTDAQRLTIEIRYCQVARASYSMRLDFMILLYTVLIVLGLHRSFTYEEVERMISSYDRDARNES